MTEDSAKCSELIDCMRKVMVSAVPRGQKIGVAFSGGIDSCLAAKLLSDLGFDIVLLSVGFKESHDLAFSSHVAALLGFQHKTLEIDESAFDMSAEDVLARISSENGNLSLIENAMAFKFISSLARSSGVNHVVTANGIDELFCGYDSYRHAVYFGYEEVHLLMEQKLDSEYRMFETIGDIVKQEYGVNLLQPFLQKEFVDFAKEIPVSKKIINSDDLLRKHIIRQAARQIGVPAISVMKRKKALQYGTLIHKSFVKHQKKKKL